MPIVTKTVNAADFTLLPINNASAQVSAVSYTLTNPILWLPANSNSTWIRCRFAALTCCPEAFSLRLLSSCVNCDLSLAETPALVYATVNQETGLSTLCSRHNMTTLYIVANGRGTTPERYCGLTSASIQFKICLEYRIQADQPWVGVSF